MKTLVSIFFCFFILSANAQHVADAEKLYTKATDSYKAGKYKEAIEDYTELLKTVSNVPLRIRIYINIGLSQDKLKLYDEAVNSFTQAIKLDNTDMLTYIDRGLSNMHAGKNKQALGDFAFVIRRNANQTSMEPALYWTAIINYHDGKYSEVIENCDAYFKVNVMDAEMHFIRGTANDRLLKFDDAIADYTLAIKYEPEYYQAYANRGSSKINKLHLIGVSKPTKEQTESACEDLNKALSMGDTSIDYLISMYCNN